GKSRTLARMQRHLGGHDLQMGDLAGGLDDGRIGLDGFALAGLGADAQGFIAGRKVDASIGDGGSAVEFDVHAAGAGKELFGETFAFLGPGLEDMKAGADLAGVNFAIRHHGAAPDLASAIIELPKFLAVLGIEAIKLAPIIRHIKPTVVNDGRSVSSSDPVYFPHEFWLTFLDLGGIQAKDSALDIRAGAFLAVADVHQIAVHDGGTIERANAGNIAPNRFAGADLDGVDAAVGAARNQQTLSVDGGDDWSRIIGSLDRRGFRPPDDFPRELVEGDIAVGPLGLRAPA